jgi:single-strand DNA-binding protein
MYQKLVLVGNLGKDPDARIIPNGQDVTTLSLATNRSYKNASGETVKETTWFKVTAWGKLALVARNYTHKGSKILVEGRLQHDENGNPRTFVRNDGTPGASFEVTAESIRLLDPKGSGDNGSSAHEPEAEGAAEDVIPF